MQKLANAKSRKSRYFGHIMRGEDKPLEKGIIEGTLPDNRKRGRPKTAWIDNVTSWTDGTEAWRYNPESGSAWRTTIRGAAYPRTAKGKARQEGVWSWYQENLQQFLRVIVKGQQDVLTPPGWPLWRTTDDTTTSVWKMPTAELWCKTLSRIKVDLVLHWT